MILIYDFRLLLTKFFQSQSGAQIYGNLIELATSCGIVPYHKGKK